MAHAHNDPTIFGYKEKTRKIELINLTDPVSKWMNGDDESFAPEHLRFSSKFRLTFSVLSCYLKHGSYCFRILIYFCSFNRRLFNARSLCCAVNPMPGIVLLSLRLCQCNRFYQRDEYRSTISINLPYVVWPWFSFRIQMTNKSPIVYYSRCKFARKDANLCIASKTGNEYDIEGQSSDAGNAHE